MIKRELIKIQINNLILIKLLIIRRIMKMIDNYLPGSEREVAPRKEKIAVNRKREIEEVDRIREITVNRKGEMIKVLRGEKIAVIQENESIVVRRKEKIVGRREEIEVCLRNEAVADRGRDHLVILEEGLHLTVEKIGRTIRIRGGQILEIAPEKETMKMREALNQVNSKQTIATRTVIIRIMKEIFVINKIKRVKVKRVD